MEETGRSRRERRIGAAIENENEKESLRRWSRREKRERGALGGKKE